MEVWVIESGDYSMRSVMGVADSIDSAVASIKETYGPPYQVEWLPVEYGDYPQLTGKFEAVSGYSTRHAASFSFTAYDLIEKEIAGQTEMGGMGG